MLKLYGIPRFEHFFCLIKLNCQSSNFTALGKPAGCGRGSDLSKVSIGVSHLTPALLLSSYPKHQSSKSSMLTFLPKEMW